MEVDNYITAGVTILGALVTIGVVVSRFTKTKKDDEFFQRLKQAISFKSIEK